MGLIYIGVDMLIGTRRWTIPHLIIVMHYVAMWLMSSFFLYIATGQVVYAVQDPQYVPQAVSFLFYPVFVAYYLIAFFVMYSIDKLFGRVAAVISVKQVPN